MTSRLACVLLVTSLAACGSSNNTTTDSGNGSGSAAQMITITGTAKSNSGTSTSPLAGVAIGAYSNSDESTAVATATSDTGGNYTLMVNTGGHPLDGYIKATITGYLDTYLYPPAPLAADLNGAALNIVTTNTFNLVSTLCQASQTTADGGIALEVVDSAGMPIAGATVSSTPAAAKYCYNGSNALPDHAATATAVDGLAYMFQVTGEATVTATETGKTFKSHPVNARAGALTTTQVMAQ
jgi:hypothetical protein